MCCCNSDAMITTTTNHTHITSQHQHQQQEASLRSSHREEYDSVNNTLVNMSYAIKPLNLQGGQCTWCGKYGHKRVSCPLLK